MQSVEGALVGLSALFFIWGLSLYSLKRYLDKVREYELHNHNKQQ